MFAESVTNFVENFGKICHFNRQKEISVCKRIFFIYLIINRFLCKTVWNVVKK